MQTMIRRRPTGLAVAFLAVLVLTACAGAMGEPPPPAGEARTLEHQGIERHYYLHNIEATASAPVPLVVSLHGYRGTEQALTERNDLSQIAWGSLDRVASREGFIVAYPHAWLGHWSLFEGLADAERVYLTGFSDGAIMSYKLLCTAEAPFAAAAPAAGTMYQKHRDTCAATAPTPLMVIAGTDDRILPYDGWIFPTGREISIPETMEHFRLLHGCTGQTAKLRDDRNTGDGSRVLEVVWTGCGAPNAVKLLRVEGGGHNWPSHEPLPDAWRGWSGTHNRDIESAEEIWAFLRQFRKGDVTP